MVCLLYGPVANALNLDPAKYNQTAASSAHIRGRFNPNMDPATAQSAAEYHLKMAGISQTAVRNY